MKKLIYRKGILLKIVSWENDADNYRTVETVIDTVEEAKAIGRLCKEVFKAYHDGPFGISNDFQADIGKYESRIIEFMSNDEFFKNTAEEDMIGLVEDYAYDLLGYTDYSARVCESCEIFEIKEDVYLDIVKV